MRSGYNTAKYTDQAPVEEVQKKSGKIVQFKRTLAGLSYAEQKEALKPPAPIQFMAVQFQSQKVVQLDGGDREEEEVHDFPEQQVKGRLPELGDALKNLKASTTYVDGRFKWEPLGNEYDQSKGRFLKSASVARNLLEACGKEHSGDAYEDRKTRYGKAILDYNGFSFKAASIKNQVSCVQNLCYEVDRSVDTTQGFLLLQGLASAKKDGSIGLDVDALNEQIEIVRQGMKTSGEMVATGMLDLRLGGGFQNKMEKVQAAQFGLNSAVATIRGKAATNSVNKEREELASIQKVIGLCDTVGGAVETVTGTVSSVRTSLDSFQTQVKELDGTILVEKPNYFEASKQYGVAATSTLGKITKFFFDDKMKKLQAVINAAETEANQMALFSEASKLKEKFAAFKAAINELKLEIDKIKLAADDQIAQLNNLGCEYDDKLKAKEELAQDSEIVGPAMLALGQILESSSFLREVGPHLQGTEKKADGFSNELVAHTNGSYGLNDLNELREEQQEQVEYYHQVGIQIAEVRKAYASQLKMFGGIADKFDKLLATRRRR